MAQVQLLAPTEADMVTGFREIDSGDANVPNRYECLRRIDAGAICYQQFDTRRGLGSHQGRGHTRKAMQGAKAAEKDELATEIGRAIMGGALPLELERRVIARIRDLAIAHDHAEVAGLAAALLTLLGGYRGGDGALAVDRGRE